MQGVHPRGKLNTALMARNLPVPERPMVHDLEVVATIAAGDYYVRSLEPRPFLRPHSDRMRRQR